MTDQHQKHWLKDHTGYWLAYVLIVFLQAFVTDFQMWEPGLLSFFVFLGSFFVINLAVAFLILLLTWPARRNLAFSRYIKILIAFSAVYISSQLIAAAIAYLQG